MKLKIIANHGVLAHEKHPAYSIGAKLSDIYDRITVEIPDEYPISESVTGEPLIDLDGRTYLLSEVLTNWGDMPCIRWTNKDGKPQRRNLKIVQEEG